MCFFYNSMVCWPSGTWSRISVSRALYRWNWTWSCFYAWFGSLIPKKLSIFKLFIRFWTELFLQNIQKSAQFQTFDQNQHQFWHPACDSVNSRTVFNTRKNLHAPHERAASFQLTFFFSLNTLVSLYGSGFKTHGNPRWRGGSTALCGDAALQAAILKRESFSCFTGERRRRKWFTGSRRFQPPGGAVQALRSGAGNPARLRQGAASGPECAAGS